MKDPRTLQSLGCYLGMVLLVGQFVLRAFGIPFDKLFLGGSFVMVLGAMYGPDFVIELIRAVRRGEYGRERRNED